jgi:hypothetical protein
MGQILPVELRARFHHLPACESPLAGLLTHRVRGFPMLQRFVAGNQVDRRQRLLKVIVETFRGQAHNLNWAN